MPERIFMDKAGTTQAGLSSLDLTAALPGSFQSLSTVRERPPCKALPRRPKGGEGSVGGWFPVEWGCFSELRGPSRLLLPFPLLLQK